MLVAVRLVIDDRKSGTIYYSLKELTFEFLHSKLKEEEGKSWYIVHDGSKFTEKNLDHVKKQWVLNKNPMPIIELTPKVDDEKYKILDLFDKNNK